MAEIDSNYKFLKTEEIAKNVAEKALDEFLYNGKSIREWMQIIASEDAISRQAVLDTMSELNAISFYEAQEDSKECYYEIRQAVENMQPVNPQVKTGHWIYEKRKRLINETDEGAEYITDYWCKCSNCGGDFGYIKMKDAFCKYCGAKMIQESEGLDEG